MYSATVNLLGALPAGPALSIMSSMSTIREHEVAFCGDVKSWADALFAQHPEWPFDRAAIEQYSAGSRKRHDLRIYRRGSQSPVISGEVKMPGTPEGQSPYAADLMQDAYQKADSIQCPFFFTWNINTLALFDRSRYNVPMMERRVRDWELGIRLTNPSDCRRPDVQAEIRDRFLPRLFADLAAIVEGAAGEWGIKPDILFLRSLETHLDWPVYATRDYLIETCRQDKSFAALFQSWMADEMNWTFDPGNERDWGAAIERAARTLCYVFSNRAIFYEALRARFPELNPLTIQERSRTGHSGIYEAFRAHFEQAMRITGDYEPIFYPQVKDWAGSLIFASQQARQGWKGVLQNLAHYDFRQIPFDIVGGIFQKLIAPEERYKFGQYFTNEDIVDVINAFCIRRAGDVVLDPACGSGSFLVRAYHRKAWLSHQGRRGRNQDLALSHQELLAEIYGCDIAVFAAHLATLNLASRHIEDEENYPRIARRNFFEVPEQRQAFCRLPQIPLEGDIGKKALMPVAMPPLDAVIGNPPYVRQELIPRRAQIKRTPGESAESHAIRLKTAKEHLHELCARMWPGLRLSGRSDLHCYFWPAAAGLLKDDGYFGFLTSSSWLDVEYGFELQGWVLRNFKILAVIESLDEPWFQDARVKTAVTILQRCKDEKARMNNVVRFVRLQKPVCDLLGTRAPGDETARQHAAERLRTLVLKTDKLHITDQLRIIPVPQSRLWQEGVAARKLLKDDAILPANGDDGDKDDAGHEPTPIGSDAEYAAGKWGRFLRAPEIYFRLLEKYGNRFVKLGEIADVRFGIKSGCDAFFMPRDVTAEVRRNIQDGLAWNNLPLMTPCKLKEVQDGKVMIIKAGDGTLHPIEAEYVRPEIHSLMQVERPVIHASDTDRVVLWVSRELSDIAGTYAAKYIRWGARQTFASKKSKAVPVPERSTCAARPRWYDLTSDRIGISFWPKAQQYRHIIPINPQLLVCNCNLYTLIPGMNNKEEEAALSAILNSTIVALMKCFYGRYAGTEGALKTEVVDVVLLEIPDPRGVSGRLVKTMQQALDSMSRRPVTHLVQESMLQCHSEENMREILKQPAELSSELQKEDRHILDDAVLQMLGVKNPKERRKILDDLYAQTADYYRFQRTLEIQGMRNRASAGSARFGPQDLAEGIWDSLSAEERGAPVPAWIAQRWPAAGKVEIPEGSARAYGAVDMFDSAQVSFKTGAAIKTNGYAHAAQAALVEFLSGMGITGEIKLPEAADDCRYCQQELHNRLCQAKERFAALAATRTGNAEMQEKTAALLFRWHMHGRE